MTKDTQVLSITTDSGDVNLDLIRKTLAPNLTDDELLLFAHVCKQTGLDPWRRQIYAIKRGGKVTHQVGIDGFRLIAERTGCYAPGRDTEFLFDKDGRLRGAKVFVKKLVNNEWHEVSATAYLHEYSTGQNLWKTMPSVMIEKCAESRALRRAFPADFSGIYSEDEMAQADAQFVDTPAPAVIEQSVKFCTDEQIARLQELIPHYLQKGHPHNVIARTLFLACNIKAWDKIMAKDYKAAEAFINDSLKKYTEDHQNHE